VTRRAVRASEVAEGLLSRRGTGKSTIAGALALLAARAGRRVLCVEVDAKGAATCWKS
jgi:predicted RNA methylase